LLCCGLVGVRAWLVATHPHPAHHSALHTQNSHPKRLCVDALDSLQFSRLLPAPHSFPPPSAFADLALADNPVLPQHTKVSQYNRPPPLA
jgi:hypothetical protein